MSKKEKPSEPYEPSFEELKQKRHDEELRKLPPGLRELAEQAEQLTELTGLADLDEHHVCQPPPFNAPPKDPGFGATLVKEWRCTCGLRWEWHWTSRTWHPVQELE